MITYKYAYNSHGMIIDIEQLSDEFSSSDSTENFTCISCGNSLIAKIKGEKRAKHFAHKSNTFKCSRETYLHRLGKNIFYNTYLNCLNENKPFIIELSYPKICNKYQKLLKKKCHRGWLKKEDDLTIYFDAIHFEKKNDNFIPDLLIYNTRNIEEKVYIEIAVTHFLSKEKKRTNNLIIEIPIESEEDIERIKSRRITESHASLINFDRSPAPVNDSECVCSKRMFYCLFINNSGKCYMKHDFLHGLEAERKKRGDSITYAKIYDDEEYYCGDDNEESYCGDDNEESYCNDKFHPYPGMIFIRLVRQAKERGVYLKNCYICRYSGENLDSFSEHGAYCKFLKKVHNSNTAVDCKYFRLPKNEAPNPLI